MKITQVLLLLFSLFWFLRVFKVLSMHVSYVSVNVILYEILTGHTDFVFSFYELDTYILLYLSSSLSLIIYHETR